MITSASHEHDAEVTPNAKSVIWAAIVIFALAVTIYYLLPHPQHPPARPAQIAIAQNPAEQTPRDRILRRRPRPRRPEVESSDAPRLEFVTKQQQMFAAKGRTVSVDAVGEGRRIFRLRWDGKFDREHAEELKVAEGLAAHLRGLGFTSMMAQVGERIVWQKPL